MEYVAKRIVNRMISDEVINENDGVYYVYSIQILLEKTICLLSVFIIALIINKVVEISCFLFAFILIRRFADGYHCESFWSCYITSLLMIFSSLPISDSLKMNTSFCQGGGDIVNDIYHFDWEYKSPQPEFNRF